MKCQWGRSVGGFTLIEILVVIFIISIVTSVALLTVSRNENRQIESFTHELVQLVTLAEEQAMLQPVVLGLALDEQSYQFSTFQPGEGEKKPSWTLFQDKMLGPHRIPEGIQLGVEISGQRQAAERDDNQGEEGKPAAPQVIISTNGDITPFTIYVGKRGKKPRYVITGDADGRVTSKLLS